MPTIQQSDSPEQSGKVLRTALWFRLPVELKRRLLIFAASQQPKRTVAGVLIVAAEEYLDRNSTEPVPTVREIVRKERGEGD